MRFVFLLRIAPILFLSSPFFIPNKGEARQSDVRGTVSDSVSGERIPYANVVILGLGKGSPANVSGFYLIPNVPAGAYDVAVSVMGYQRQIKPLVVSGLGPVTLNFRLTSTEVELEEVLISEQRKPELLEIQTSVHVVDKMELKQVPVTTQGDILRSVQILPGIVSTSDVNAQFYVRGGGSDQNLILLDGMRIYNPFHAFGLFSSFDPDIVRTTEVYTGAFPADFGGRLSSVINMVSRDGHASQFSGQASVNVLSSKLQLEGPVSQVIQAVFTGRKSLSSRVLKDFFKEDVPLGFYDGFVKLTLKESDSQNRYSAQALVSEDKLAAGVQADADYLWSSRAFGVEANILSTDRMFWSIALTIGSFEASRDSKDPEGIPSASNKVSELGLRANITHYTDSKDIFFFGFEFYFPSAEYNFQNRLGSTSKLSETLPELSVWVRHQIKSVLFKADVGVRAEVGSLLRWGDLRAFFQPRVNLSYNLTEEWVSKLSYGRFSQGFITITNEDDILPIFTPWVVIPQTLQPQRADHVVLGIEGPILPGVSMTLQGFYKFYGSLVAYNRDKVDVNDPDYVNARGRSYGAEALLRYRHSFVDLYGAYTLTYVRVNVSGFEYPPRYDRRHTVNLLTVLHPVQNLDLSFRWEFGSGLPFTKSIGFYDKLRLNGYPDPFVYQTGTPLAVFGEKNAARLPAYHRLDASVTYQVSLFSFLNVTAGASVVNAYDRKNIFYFDRNSGKRRNMLGMFPSGNVTAEFQL